MVLWQHLERSAIEFLQWEANRGCVFRGEVVGDIGGVLGRVTYRVRVEEDGLTTSAHVQFLSHGGDRRLLLTRDSQGHWYANGSERRDLEGATDVDIGVTPATNTLPIWRLRPAVGESYNLVAVLVRFPELSLVRARQRYTRVEERRYGYESLESGYQAPLTVDENGFVVRYADLWKRLDRI